MLSCPTDHISHSDHNKETGKNTLCEVGKTKTWGGRLQLMCALSRSWGYNVYSEVTDLP